MSDVSSEGRGSSSGIKLKVAPRVCLHDAPTSIRLTGLTPASPVTLTLTTHNDAGQRYHSFAHYLSDTRGRVDVEQNEAVGGAFKGVFPMGLFTNLMEYPFNYGRLYKEDAASPWKMTVLAHEGHLTLEQSLASKGVASELLERYILAPDVRCESVVYKSVRGTLFLPTGSGPHPAVVDVLGGFGGLRLYRASMMACRGFACLALAYFNYSDLPKTLETLKLEYMEEAVEYLLQQPNVIPDRCGVLSSSKGANFGLAMGIYLPKVTAVVCIGGLLVADTTMTFRGRELWQAASPALVSLDTDEHHKIIMNASVIKQRLSHDHPSMPPCETAPDDTYFLLIAGDKDMFPTSLALELMMHRMKLHGRESQCHTIVYSGAGHVIEPPYNAHASHSLYKFPERKMIIEWGGEPWSTCQAQEGTWHNVKKFFEMHVRDRSPWYAEYVGAGRREGGCELLHR